MADLKAIGKRIQNCRKQQGLIQEELADRMNDSIQMISNLERGNKAICIDNLVNLCQILNASTDYILTGKECSADLTALADSISQLDHRDQKMIALLVEYCIANK